MEKLFFLTRARWEITQVGSNSVPSQLWFYFVKILVFLDCFNASSVTIPILDEFLLVYLIKIASSLLFNSYTSLFPDRPASIRLALRRTFSSEVFSHFLFAANPENLKSGRK